jgi:hypothetical protein
MSAVLLAFFVFPPGPAARAGGAAEPPPVPTIRVAVPAEAPRPHRALRYALLPEPVDLQPGNAAPQWVRAGQSAVEAGRKLTDKESAWGSSDLPLDKLPREEVRRFLAGAESALRQAERAARYERCDWELPPLTIQTVADIPLAEVQQVRVLAALLSIRCRLELSERRFDDAARTLQTGFAMARHIGEAPTLLHNLVGVAVASIMLARVEEWVQVPGSPDLYWPLTALPRPLISNRPALLNESGTVYRSFPQLRSLAREKLTAEQGEQLAADLLRAIAPLSGDKPPPEWQARLALAALATKAFPEARRHLLTRGRTAAEVEAMPALQVVLIYQLDQHDVIWDEILKTLYLPYWQASPILEEAEKKVRGARSDLNVVVGLLMPAILKVQQAGVRLERQLAGARCAEAVRLHAALHQGQLPTALKDVTDVPLPTDPVTGKGFDELYRAGDGKAVLDVPPPPPPGQPASLGRRYEFVPLAKGEGKTK